MNKHHLPLVIFVTIITFMWHGLGNTAEQFPCELIGEPVPHFSLKNLVDEKQNVTEKVFIGKTTILEVWSSFCRGCAKQHALMQELVDQDKVQLIGLDYKDRKKDALAWLQKHGNMYKVVIYDPEGSFGKSIDVYGTPTTYIIDKEGIIRFRYFGLIKREQWNEIIVPELKLLESKEDK